MLWISEVVGVDLIFRKNTSEKEWVEYINNNNNPDYFPTRKGGLYKIISVYSCFCNIVW